jgi:hypothetical protein
MEQFVQSTTNLQLVAAVLTNWLLRNVTVEWSHTPLSRFMLTLVALAVSERAVKRLFATNKVLLFMTAESMLRNRDMESV